MSVWIGRLVNFVRRRSIPELVILGVVSTSAVSLMLSVATSGALLKWLEEWLLDFSTDLAGGGATFIFLKMLLNSRENDQKAELEPAARTYFIDAVEISAEQLKQQQPTPYEEKQASKSRLLEDALAELKHATTPEARQFILNRMASQNISLQRVTLVDMVLERADLNGANLREADLTNARLRAANLQGADLRGAQLNMTQLIEANMQGVNLSGAVLERTFLSGADLRGARLHRTRVRCSLWGVNLQGADLQEADLRGAELFRTNLRDANLTGVQLAEAKINSDTVLPDGSYWQRGVDITRFTDPNHPQFWRSGGAANGDS